MGTKEQWRREVITRLSSMLSDEQREIAKISGISEPEYAINLLRLYKAKIEDGRYRGRYDDE